jgi:chromosome segregation ATPase
MMTAREKDFESRLRSIESEVEGEKALTRHIFKKASGNDGEIAAIRVEITTLRLQAERAAGNVELVKTMQVSQGTMLNILAQDVREIRTEIGQMNAQMGEMRMEMGEMSTEIGGIRAGMGEMRAGMGEMHTGMGEMRAGMREMQTRMGEMRTGMGEMHTGIRETHARLDAMERSIDARFDAMQRNVDAKFDAVLAAIRTIAPHAAPAL